MKLYKSLLSVSMTASSTVVIMLLINIIIKWVKQGFIVNNFEINEKCQVQ